jgi:hypothetical protein
MDPLIDDMAFQVAHVDHEVTQRVPLEEPSSSRYDEPS